MVPGPAFSASPKNLVEMPILGLTPDMLCQKPWVGPVICALTSSSGMHIPAEDCWPEQEIGRGQM